MANVSTDFLHSLNNAAADLYVLARKKTMDPSLMCNLNGFVEQVTDQVCSIYRGGRLLVTMQRLPIVLF